MDRAPSLQDASSETGDQPEPQGSGIDYKEIAREVLARIDQRLANLEAEPAADPSEAQFGSDTVSSIMSSRDQAAFVGLARRGLIGLVLSAGLVAAISFLWSHHDTAIQSVAQWVPRFDLGAATPAAKPEPGPLATTRADAAQAQAVPPPRSALDKANPAPVPPELAELMRKVDRNIAGLAQAVTELRLAHQQVTVDNARTVEDIKASLDQMARVMATATASEAREAEQVAQTKPPAQLTPARPPAQFTQARPAPPDPQTTARRTRRYVPPYLSPNDAMGYMR